MSYVIHYVELDGPWEGHEDCRSEVCGGFSEGPFESLDAAKSRLSEVISTPDEYLDGCIFVQETKEQVTYLHGSYLF